MEASLKINNYSDLNLSLFTKLLKDIVTEFGSVEITIKPQIAYKPELLNRIKDVKNGNFVSC